MNGKRSIVTFLAGAAVVPALALSGCGSSGSGKSASSSPAASPAASSATKSATVDVAKTGLGNVLVDSQGRTLYLFLADKGTTSECTGACATAWPPLEASSMPTAANGAEASLVGTTMRSDGKTQVTYNGHPVYLFQGDTKPGDTTGQAVVAFGAGWFALSPAGAQVSGSGSSSGGSGSSGGGGGY
jgi:predicted lipoprotein with Yx(FWY)xxD motif